MYKRTVKKKQDRRGRFRTQPVTFMEIKVIVLLLLIFHAGVNKKPCIDIHPCFYRDQCDSADL